MIGCRKRRVTGGPNHLVSVRYEGDVFVIHDPLKFRPFKYKSPPDRISGPAVVILARD